MVSSVLLPAEVIHTLKLPHIQPSNQTHCRNVLHHLSRVVVLPGRGRKGLAGAVRAGTPSFWVCLCLPAQHDFMHNPQAKEAVKGKVKTLSKSTSTKLSI